MLEEKKIDVSIKLENALKRIKYDNRISELKKYFEKQYINKYIPIGKLYQILDLSFNLITLEDKELYIITKTILTWPDGKKYLDINLDAEFEREDMDIAENVLDMNNTLTIKALFKGTEENPEWIGIMTYKDIVNADTNGLLRYNMDTQRVPDIVIRDGNVHYIPEIDKHTISDIADAILEDRFQTNTITLNIVRTDEPYINPANEPGELTININDNAKIDIIDGMHRVKGIIKAWQKREKEILLKEETKQIEGVMAVSVKNLTAEKAKKFIYQESLANQQSDKTKAVLSEQAAFKKFVQALNEEDNSIYYNRFVYYGGSSNKIPRMFLFSMMKEFSLVTEFNKCSRKTIRKITEHFFEFEDDVFEILDEAKKKRIYNDMFFLTDLILYFMICVIENKLDIKSNDAMVKEFVSKVEMRDIEEFKYDFPLNRKEKIRLKELLSCNINKESEGDM